MSTLPKEIYTVNKIPMKIPMATFSETEKNNPNIHMEPQNTLKCKTNPFLLNFLLLFYYSCPSFAPFSLLCHPQAKTILKIRNKVGGLTLLTPEHVT